MQNQVGCMKTCRIDTAIKQILRQPGDNTPEIIGYRDIKSLVWLHPEEKQIVKRKTLKKWIIINIQPVIKYYKIIGTSLPVYNQNRCNKKETDQQAASYIEEIVIYGIFNVHKNINISIPQFRLWILIHAHIFNHFISFCQHIFRPDILQAQIIPVTWGVSVVKGG